MTLPTYLIPIPATTQQGDNNLEFRQWKPCLQQSIIWETVQCSLSSINKCNKPFLAGFGSWTQPPGLILSWSQCSGLNVGSNFASILCLIQNFTFFCNLANLFSYLDTFFSVGFTYLDCDHFRLRVVHPSLNLTTRTCWAGPSGIPGYPGIPGLDWNPDPGIFENQIPGFFGIW